MIKGCKMSSFLKAGWFQFVYCISNIQIQLNHNKNSYGYRRLNAAILISEKYSFKRL